MRASDIHLEPAREPACACATASTACCARWRRRRHGCAARSSRASRSWPSSTSPSGAWRRTAASRLAVRGKEIDFRVSTTPSIHGESVVMRILDRGSLALDFAALGFDAELLAALPRGARPPARHRAGHRPHRQRQDDDALHRADRAELAGQQDPHRRGSGRIPARGHQPDPGPAADRADLRQRAALLPAPGPRHHHDRRDPRPGDRADRGPGGADRPSGAVDRCTPTTPPAR